MMKKNIVRKYPTRRNRYGGVSRIKNTTTTAPSDYEDSSIVSVDEINDRDLLELLEANKQQHEIMINKCEIKALITEIPDTEPTEAVDLVELLTDTADIAVPSNSMSVVIKNAATALTNQPTVDCVTPDSISKHDPINIASYLDQLLSTDNTTDGKSVVERVNVENVVDAKPPIMVDDQFTAINQSSITKECDIAQRPHTIAEEQVMITKDSTSSVEHLTIQENRSFKVIDEVSNPELSSIAEEQDIASGFASITEESGSDSKLMSIMEELDVASQLSGITEQDNNPEPDSIVEVLATGLQNLGNTCYANSIIQCLVNTEPLVEMLVIKTNNDERFKNAQICKELLTLLLVLKSGQYRSPVEPRNFMEALKKACPKFESRRQQDAHELLIEIVTQM